jgi:2-oxoisovalerate dehydrogenase E1 component
MKARDDIVLIGEDILDPYGGAFKVYKGISTAHPNRVISTPISESAIVGIGCGLALKGHHPIIEIMFGDFITLALDQIINHISVFQDGREDAKKIPILIRTPMGGGRGYGPTHSKSIERLLLGIPNINVLAISEYIDIGDTIMGAIDSKSSVVLIENKLVYGRFQKKIKNQKIDGFNIRYRKLAYPEISLSATNFINDSWTIVTYGGMGELVMKAVDYLLINYEISAEVIILSCIQPLDTSRIIESVRKTGALLCVEEGIPIASFGSEVVSGVMREVWSSIRCAPGILGALNCSIPAASHLESVVLLDWRDVVNYILNEEGENI